MTDENFSRNAHLNPDYSSNSYAIYFFFLPFMSYTRKSNML